MSSSLLISYTRLHRNQISDELLLKCATLFSKHYGIWSEKGFVPGKHVKLSLDKIKQQFLFDNNNYIVIATDFTTSEVIGHAIGARFYCDFLKGHASWITQLVVHTDYRNKGVATRLCQLSWNPKIDYVCGIVSSNPYAIEALSNATNCVIEPRLIIQYLPQLITLSNIPYLTNALTTASNTLPTASPTTIQIDRCVLNTNFHICHDEVDQIRRSIADWLLGELYEGEEYAVVYFPKRKRKRAA